MSRFWDYLKDGSILLAAAIGVLVIASLGVFGVWLGALGSVGAVGWARARAS